ncbi:capping protein-inhibiting regulator of actin dynamics isoform X2 [Protopterus annectens]|uniref:capping protein-inhibiting regulator of actin dynamics isoform X2 n=1 Tax=Protopterus annectens TaxID=7888 RepID=UPI001CFC19E7|nr:capping protein-inhibiting regulator of actin dynamics isoform X2 [Protopterus annectens]
MASDSMDVKETDNSGAVDIGLTDKKRPGKFQPFKKLFGKKKHKDHSLIIEEVQQKLSQSTEDVFSSVLSEDEETNNDLSNNMCTRAFSHESIFIPDGSTEDKLSGQAISQENISEKVKTLQQQLTQNIKFGQPTINSASKMEDTGYSDEIEELPDSPMETHQEVNLSYRYNKVSPVKPKNKRSFPAAGTIESINLDAIPLYVSRLDNSAARHKLSVKPKNQRASKKHSRITKEMQHMTLHGSENEINRIKVHADIEIRHHEDAGYSLVGEENHFMEKQRLILAEEKRKQEEHQRYLLVQEQRRKEEAEQQRRQEEERLRVFEEQKRKEEQIRREEEERHRQEEEEKQRLLELQKREAEEKLLREIEERKRLEQQRQQEIEEERKRLARQKQQEIEERRRQEEQRQLEILKLKQQEEQKRQKAEELRRRQELEEIRLRAVQQEQLEKARKYQEEEEKQRRLEEEEQRQREEERKILEAQKEQQMREELRWQEVDERQTMPRPFTFKVSSGEKIFQKVNLSPVTPMKELSVSLASKESKAPSESKTSHPLQSSSSVPHTAILVTGAQLCGSSVNLDHIKDTACKSLLGLADERKHVAFPTVENLPSRAKLKYKQETIDHQSFLNEWASIRSKIMKSAENGNIYDKDKSHSGRHSDDWTSKVSGDLRSNLRKTMSASAKFSITPAWQKFMDTNKPSDNIATVQRQEQESIQKESLSSDEVFINVAEPLIIGSVGSQQGTAQEDKSEKYTMAVDNSEGCKFAKDLPSFLVPSLPGIPHRGLTQSEPQITTDSHTSANHIRKMDRGEKAILNSEEKTSPFGIKLRRTNYSLRFHCDHHVENKKKKRYSAGDSFDGVPDPLVSLEQEIETNGFSKKQLALSSKTKSDASTDVIKDSSNSVFDDPNTIGVPFLSQSKNHSSALNNDMFFSKQFLHQKPVVAPKPPSSTPPSSPLSSAIKSSVVEMLAQRTANTEQLDVNRKKEDAANVLFQPLKFDQKEDEEMKERRSFLPAIHIPWREKSERKPDLLRREKPVLQSMHSLDGSRVVQKAEAAQPLWITLALQKQKGFREQQAARDERRHIREAKQVERLANSLATSITDSSSSASSRLSVLQKPVIAGEERKVDTIVSRVERREYLRKSNTLPNSVTDSVTLAPSVKEVSKRFSTPDATPVSTEPVWLALAKRKAKAWSDCPQIIK